jgi:hypothetical protein
MNLNFAGPTNKSYTGGGTPIPTLPHSRAISPSNAQNCENCLKTALQCGSQPTLVELENCQKAQREVKSIISNGCTLQAKAFTSFPIAAAQQCSSLCSNDLTLEYGAGYTRPYSQTQAMSVGEMGM